MYNQRRGFYGNNRFGGGFLGPFILGGITGGLLAPSFYRPYPNYNYNVYPQYYPYPYHYSTYNYYY